MRVCAGLVSRRAGVLVLVQLALVSFALPVDAADEQAVVQQMTALNQSAIDAYSDGDVDRAKSDLRKAVSLGEANNLADHPVMARTYLHLGIMHVDWFEDVAAGKRYFRRALEIAPEMRLTSALATKSAKAAFGEARAQIGVAASAPTGGDRAEADRANELRQRISVLERDRQERERQVADTKRRLDQLENERQEKDRQLADARQRLLQLERTRHGRDRPLRERRAKTESAARQP